MDGKRVPNLVKKLDSNTNIDDVAAKDDSQKDDYVLSKLFKKAKKSGQSRISTALQHDKIVENTDPDYVLVETEAERVANEAIKSLKRSRKFCHPAESGMPNLSGLKFGGKSKLLNIYNTNTSDTKAEQLVEDNSSASLINHIKHRENLTNITSNNSEAKFLDMAEEIREYLVYKSSRQGEASTAELIDHFKVKLTPDTSIKFKAVLKKLCVFHLISNKTGVWKLKDEYGLGL